MAETPLVTHNSIKKRAARMRSPSNLFYTNVSQQENPFVDQIQDSDELKKLFRDRPFIPYSGTAQNPQHTLLAVLKTLSELSPTQSSVLNAMSFYCYGGKVSIVESVDTEFAMEQNEFSGPQANKYFESLMLVKPELGFREMAKMLFKSRKYCGEHYVRVNYFQLAGTRQAKIGFIDPTKIMPVITDPGSPETFIVFQEFNEETLTKKKYELIGKYPYITRNADGSMSTVIQYKNGIGVRGRPAETGIMIDQYREYKDNIFLTRQSANNFTGQVLIEIEEADPNTTEAMEQDAIDAGFSGLEERLRMNFTNEGDSPQSLMYITRPFGTRQAMIHEFAQNTSEKWFNITGGITESRIIKAHSWSKRLMDGEVANGLSSNVFLDELKIKLPLIDNHQAVEEKTINTAIDSALGWMGVDFSGVDIKFNNPYKTILDAYNGMGSGKTQPPEQGVPG